MKILINTPDIKLPGGVANHYKGLAKYWREDVTYNYIGGRKGIPGPAILIYDYLKFIILCLFKKPDVILLNPSLGKTALQRDALFLKIAKLMNIKTFVFIHGWNADLANEISGDPFDFRNKFIKADAFLVLASDFKLLISNWGLKQPIYVVSTKVDDKLIESFDIDHKPISNRLLFLARVEKEKGIFTTLEVFKNLQNHINNIELIVAGSGSALKDAKAFVSKEKIQNVKFLGNISGDTLINTFKKSSIYILPTTHGEGMPTSVLEAMAFGLPVISRPIGGVKDFFQEEKMGFLINSLESNKYAAKIKYLLNNKEILKAMGVFNHNYARNNFLASKVASEIENICAQ